ncbi:hypothetical protein [Sulfurimonas sp.]|uniref:hypothetical protein n=1 Tax=Sulfurimonas sp. TaxID=2022749 RepID=UPI003565A212
MKSIVYVISVLMMILSFSGCNQPAPAGGGVCENPKCKCPKPCQCGSACRCGINGNSNNMSENK